MLGFLEMLRAWLRGPDTPRPYGHSLPIRPVQRLPVGTGPSLVVTDEIEEPETDKTVVTIKPIASPEATTDRPAPQVFVLDASDEIPPMAEDRKAGFFPPWKTNRSNARRDTYVPLSRREWLYLSHEAAKQKMPVHSYLRVKLGLPLLPE